MELWKPAPCLPREPTGKTQTNSQTTGLLRFSYHLLFEPAVMAHLTLSISATAHVQQHLCVIHQGLSEQSSPSPQPHLHHSPSPRRQTDTRLHDSPLFISLTSIIVSRKQSSTASCISGGGGCWKKKWKDRKKIEEWKTEGNQGEKRVWKQGSSWTFDDALRKRFE